MGDYPAFRKIPRLDTEFWITEKIDGTNGLIYIEEPEGDLNIAVENQPEGTHLVVTDGAGAPDFEGSSVYFVRAGSRKQWITPEQDNFGFARWVYANAEELAVTLGPGHHYGEWYGSGINRGYGLTGGEKRFMLFHVFRWHEAPPATFLVEVASVLEKVSGSDLADAVRYWHAYLRANGSVHVPGYDNPEGLVIQNRANREIFFKAPLDPKPKGPAPVTIPTQVHDDVFYDVVANQRGRVA